MKRIVLASALSGLSLAIAFPPHCLDLLAWVAFTPLLWALGASGRSARAAGCGLIFGLVFFSCNTSWIFRTLVIHGHFGFVSAAALFAAMMATLALFPGLFAFLTKLFEEKGFRVELTAPFVWTFTEFLRSVTFTGFPWDLAGYSQAERLTVVQMTDVTGIYGVSFVIVLVNCLLWRVAALLTESPRRAWKPAALAGLALLTVVIYGHIRLGEYPEKTSDGPQCKIAALQGNLPQEIKWDKELRHKTIRIYEELGEKAVKKGAKLLVWPETSVPVLFDIREATWKQAVKVSGDLRTPMLVGAPSARYEDGRDRYFNSAYLIDGTSIRFRYDKIHLVPFGEYVPFSWLLPVGPGIAAREADFSPGKRMTVMSVDGCPRFGVLICYEVIFPELARRALNRGAQMLINITNDGWFGHTAAPYQHYEMARIRAVESRTWLVRSANTGISGVFDPAGRERARLDLNVRGELTTEAPSAGAKGSFYLRYGDMFAWLCSVITIALITVSVSSRQRPLGKSAG